MRRTSRRERHFWLALVAAHFQYAIDWVVSAGGYHRVCAVCYYD